MRRATAAILIGSTLLLTAGCGSDAPSRAATAAKGDAFCTAAQAADTSGNAIDMAATPELLEASIQASVAAAKAAQKVAPTDAQALVDEAVKVQDQLVAIFKKYDYDVNTVAASEDGKAFFERLDAMVDDDLDQYNFDKCGIPIG